MTRAGNIKWYDPAKGFGFLVGDDGEHYFIHRTAVEKAAIVSLEPGYRLFFDVAPAKNYCHLPAATRLKLVQEAVRA